MADRDLEVDAGEPGFADSTRDPGDADVPLEHRRVHEARRVARPARRRRRTGTSPPGPACGPWAGSGRPRRGCGPSRASRRRCPVVRKRDVFPASSRRIASRPMNARSSVVDALEHPAEAELVGRRAVGVGPGEAAVDAKSTSSSSRPASIRVMYSACSPNGSTPNPRVASQIASHAGQRVLGLDPDLVAEVAGVAGPRDRDLAAADLAASRCPKYGRRLDAPARGPRGSAGRAGPGG